MVDDDETATRDGAPSTTGYKVSPTVTATPREARYRRGAEIARGGLGRVTEAYDQTLQRQVAIKELHQRTEQGRRRFELESLTTARLQHPAIVSVFDSGTWESGEPYLVLQLLEGTTLSEEIAQRPTLDTRLALIPNLLAIADALGYAHEQGVVHRDVKPSNIMVGKHGETVILDWGVAYDSARGAPENEILVGTPRFMSPEQARGETPVPGFDVFSLGMTIATVLTGRLPTPGEVPALPPEVPADLASIVAKATATAGRYEHAGHVANDLRRFIAGQLVSSRRYTKRELFVRWVRRRRVLLGAAAIVLVVGAIAVSSVIRERNTAIMERERAIARAHELILVEARSRLRTDPTATLAWLKEYPPSAPRQDELLALVDEAEGRLVTKHVWYPSSAVIDATTDGGGLVVATHDGAIVRVDLATGARTTLARTPAVPTYVRAAHGVVAVLDQQGTVWRIGKELVRAGTVDMEAPLTGLFIAPDGVIKVTYLDGTIAWVPGSISKHPGFAIVEHHADSRTVYAVTESGELHVGEEKLEKKWQFAPGTSIRGSDDGSHYLAIVPAESDSISLWVGAPGKDPIEIGRGRACADGEDVSTNARMSNDASIVTVLRCGVLTVHDTVRHRSISIPEPTRVQHTLPSPEGRWLVLMRTDGFDLIEAATGETRRVDPGSALAGLGFTRDGRTLFGIGLDHGLRVWSLPSATSVASPLQEAGATNRLRLAGERDLAIGRPLKCALWSTTARRIEATASVLITELRDPEDIDLVWPQSFSEDGRTCSFAGPAGTTIVLGVDGTKHAITKPTQACVLSSDGRAVACTAGSDLFVIDVATDRVTSSRTVTGSVRGLVRYRGTPTVLVANEASNECALETFDGAKLATFAGKHTCNTPRAFDSSVVFALPDRTVVWSDAGTFELPSEIDHVYPSRTGERAAVVHADRIELWDLRTATRLASPPRHARTIKFAGWSSENILASHDDETIQLWDPTTNRTRMIFARYVKSLVWSRDGRTLHASDGRVMYAFPIDLARGAADVRERIDALTTTRIVDGRPSTP